MSFGSGSGFGGFGSNTNQPTFGGFGSTNSSNTGFGSNTATSGFGQPSTGGSLFGGGSNTTSSPFGGGGSGFGTNTNTAFGSKPFGGSGTTGTSLFGGGSSTGPTFGGFGSTNTSTPAFGGGSTGGGLFGQKTTGFGTTSTGTGTGGLFGGGSTGGGFGSTTTGGFGTSTSGFGAATSTQPNNGTGSVPFSAFQEKDGTGSQHFQTITFQQPYQNYSLEELRLADYNQGRRYGNQNGQAGAFGQSTGFGGFGTGTGTTSGFGTNTGGGLFGGGGTTTSTPFGQSSTTGTGFGSTATTGGGLFGQQSKPAGGLFGTSTTTQPSGGGLFGGSTTTGTGAFGTGGGTGFGSSTTGGGLFGQQTQAQKPAFGGFGSTGTTTGTGFGSTTGTGGGLFGQQTQTTSAPAFGSTQTATTGGGLFGGGTSTGGGLFGQNQQTQTQSQPSGGLFGGFGQSGTQQQQQKPGGLFGSSTTTTGGGGLFGQAAQPQQTGGGLFGQTQQTQPQGTSLFGAKPATGGGLFGSTTQQGTGTTSGGLFGNLGTSSQPTQRTSLFGQQAQQQKPGGLFGASTTTGTGGTSLFGQTQSTTTPAFGGSLFSSQTQQQQPQQQSTGLGASLQTSINTNPYGNDALFAGLVTPTQSPGPLATPLSSSQKTRKPALLPQHKLNPSASTRLLTPQTKRAGGYGFTYSTYGTPTSANTSPSFTSSFLGGSSLSRSLGKSLSTSNLRTSYTPEASILAPGAFSTTGRSLGSGGMKKLTINRSINTRPVLFDDTPSEKKRVSFVNGLETNGTNGTEDRPSRGGELVLRAEPEREPAVDHEQSPPSRTGEINGVSEQPEMTQVNGKDLTTTPERTTSAPLNKQGGAIVDPTPGDYYSRPKLDELRKMSRSELSKVENFVVGRDRIGEIQFNPGHPVDLTGVDLDKLFGDIVQLTTRNATVYGETCTIPKPARGTGLNVFSRITLGNSWPRNKAGKKDRKHVERLKRVYGTTFEEYRPETGEWVFTVPHYSSYGLDYDGDQYSDNEDDEDDESSELSDAPDTPLQQHSGRLTATPSEASDSPTQSVDDTFEFRRRRAHVPGGFGNEAAYEEDVNMDSTGGESFLGQRSVGSLDGQQDAEYTESESGSDHEQDLAGPVSAPTQTTEQQAATVNMPKSILKNSQMLLQGMGTPSKGHLVFDDDWASQLQRTISPRKQDRQALRECQEDVLREHDEHSKFGRSTKTNDQPIFTRLGMMESLFGESEDRETKGKRAGKGFEFPYAKRPKTSDDLNRLSADDRAFHSCNKPHFDESGTLIYAAKGAKSLEDGIYRTVQQPISGSDRDIRFTKLPTFDDAAPETLTLQKKQTKISLQDGVPLAKIITEPDPLDFADMAKRVAIDTAAGQHELEVWQLLSILFDEVDEIPSETGTFSFQKYRDRFRKEKLSKFWESLVFRDAEKHAHSATTPEEKAFAYLTAHNVPDACHALLSGLDLRLATMVAQIGGDLAMRQDMASQIEEWRRLDVVSEMTEPIRALYELIAGNCAQSEGKQLEGRENKAKTFCISEEFGLDWRRAFGLRLWYGILADEPIELAVAQFADALRDGVETVKPKPWFVQEQVDIGWQDPQADSREDLLWGILKLYASAKLELPANVEDVLAPENVSGHPLNARLSFQLFQFFKSRLEDKNELWERRIGMPTVRHSDGLRRSFMSSTSSSAVKDGQSDKPLVDLGDKIAITYAASLHTPKYWTTAVFVYTHLSSASMREHYIRTLLCQYSNTYSITESDDTYTYLVQDLKIPAQWLHAAAALQAKTENDYLRQTVHLIKAGELEEAHEVLCRSVGPDSIISRDYDALRELLGEFVPTPVSSPVDEVSSTVSRGRHTREPVPGWSHGGQIYFDYIHLLDLTAHQSSYRVDKELNEEIGNLLFRLQNGLEVAARDRCERCGLEERVALMEIASVVANLVTKDKHLERARVLKLPLAEDMWLRHSCDLSLNYYKAVMAAGK
ncbi:uncharacterized protein EI97DRAFT_432771 [Westerdykella ornata]|uniref:Peptidase S59 domain-containing protein n=1 Tax=Westerdykella ornata TaxID=318751 RepID=A0A6A6JL04_WESOR|nr:uncharacterized protein EI97DRAFT_432771 [Westerdykella ornata]KAF2277162.1 hypothetical protein EI97DRAFT_432771 [Westerdykella ornata]